MKLSARLTKLEQIKTSLAERSDVRDPLYELMKQTYTRVEGEVFSACWLNSQSVLTALSIAMFAPMPLSACVLERLAEIQKREGPEGKLAKSLMEAVI